MKMSASLFWGLILILIGISIIIKIVFNIDFSIFRVVFALVLIYFGIRLFIGRDFKVYQNDKDEQLIIFSRRVVTHVEKDKEYNVIFGDGKFDLRNFSVPDGEVLHLRLNTIFGGSEIILNPEIPVEINSQTAFGGTRMPNYNESSFGDSSYKNDTAKKTSAKIIFETNTVFGALHVHER
jgi:predicted membrane protein